MTRTRKAFAAALVALSLLGGVACGGDDTPEGDEGGGTESPIDDGTGDSGTEGGGTGGGSEVDDGGAGDAGETGTDGGSDGGSDMGSNDGSETSTP